jgi:hypothetical protein
MLDRYEVELAADGDTVFCTRPRLTVTVRVVTVEAAGLEPPTSVTATTTAARASGASASVTSGGRRRRASDLDPAVEEAGTIEASQPQPWRAESGRRIS